MRSLLIFLALIAIVGSAAADLYPGKINTGAQLQSDAPGSRNYEGQIAIQLVGNATVGPRVADDDWMLLAGNTTGAGWRNLTAANLSNQPDYARLVTITVNVSTTGDAYLAGTDIAGSNITETISWNSSAAVKTSTRAFKTITSLKLHGFSPTYTTLKAGYGSGLGLNCKLPTNTTLMASLDGTKTAISSTSLNSTVLSKNTFTLGAALDGKPVKIWYIVNA